jgi:hypothetical protein
MNTAQHTVGRTPGPQGSPQTIVLAPRFDTGRGRLLGRSGDVSIQVGARNRNKQ